MKYANPKFITDMMWDKFVGKQLVQGRTTCDYMLSYHNRRRRVYTNISRFAVGPLFIIENGEPLYLTQEIERALITLPR